MLHDSEADQKHNKNQATAESGLDNIIVELARDCHPGTEQPYERKQPGGNKHHRSVITFDCQITDDEDTGYDRERQRHACDARCDRWIEYCYACERNEPQHPCHRAITEMIMPSVEIEIGEQKNHQRGGECHFRARSPDLLVAGRDLHQLVPEAKVDTDIGQYSPRKRCSCRE
ncbi:hypothetical protein FQZ97_827670 [compost metagenome]